MYYKLKFSFYNLYCPKHLTKSISYIYNKFCDTDLCYKLLEFKHVLENEFFPKHFSRKHFLK